MPEEIRQEKKCKGRWLDLCRWMKHGLTVFPFVFVLPVPLLSLSLLRLQTLRADPLLRLLLELSRVPEQVHLCSV
jgi:hypothetical protein